MPVRDYVRLAAEFAGQSEAPSLAPRIPVLALAQVGAEKSFWVADLDRSSVYTITATLVVATEQLELWVEQGTPVDAEALQRSAQRFSESTYPLTRATFGSEWTPGIDGNPRLLVLNANLRGASGYFGSANEYAATVNLYSNEAEIVFMSTALPAGTDSYDAVLAHEFQHMIQWHQDANEDAWLNEGSSELAEMLNGFGWSSATVSEFARQPDIQLTTWASEGSALIAHYGASFLFMRFFADRFGSDALTRLVQSPLNGMAAVREQLVALKAGGLDELVADWVVANLIDARLETGAWDAEALSRYSYPAVTVAAQTQTTVGQPSVDIAADVSPYGTDYYELDPLRLDDEGLHLRFVAQPEIARLPLVLPEGGHTWWSNRGDASHSSLRGGLDLRAVVSATMHYDLWYDIENGWDYAYVRVSTDDGRTWTPLETERMTGHDPLGNALAKGYTGPSRSLPTDPSRAALGTPEWVQDQVDLSPFCGHQVLVQFDYVTDDAVTEAGLCLGALSVPEIGYAVDWSVTDGGWLPNGFVWTNNRVSPEYLLQVIYLGEGHVEVERIRAGSDGLADSLIARPTLPERIVLAVTALADGTTEKAPYRLRID
jgi:hypothetical protein